MLWLYLPAVTILSQPKFACVRSMEELGVIFADVVAAAWLTPT
jgi:hypothetical protein